MTDITKLFMTEKQQALLQMALDRYISWMHETNCCLSACAMFEKLEHWVRNYDLRTAAEIAKAWGYAGELMQEADEEPYPADEFAQDLVDSLDDDDAMNVYEVLCKRLNAEPDVDVPTKRLRDLMQKPSVFERDPRQTDIEDAIKQKQEELMKLHAMRASQVPTEVNPNEALPSDVEPKDEADPKIIDNVFGEAAHAHPYVAALRSLQVDTRRAR